MTQAVDTITCQKCLIPKAANDMRSHLWNGKKVPDKTCKKCHSEYVAAQTAQQKQNRQDAYQGLVQLYDRLLRTRPTPSQSKLLKQMKEAIQQLE